MKLSSQLLTNVLNPPSFFTGMPESKTIRGDLPRRSNKPSVHPNATARQSITEMKSRQAAKIRELGQSLIDAGFVTLAQQSEVLGVARSTTWTIMRASHKHTGLSAAVINRMLLSPELPPLARRKILEYTTDKLAGVYGGSRSQLRKFAARLSIEKLPVCRETESTLVPEHNGITRANGERSRVIPEGPIWS
jgi:hypothetical protein